MEIRYCLQRTDLEQLQRHVQTRRLSKDLLARLGIWATVGFIASFAWQSQQQVDGNWLRYWSWILTAAIFAASWLGLQIWRLTRHGQGWLEQFAGDYNLVATPAGVSISAPDGRVGFNAWPDIIGFETTATHLYLYLRRDVAFSIPLVGLGEDAAVFSEQLHALWATHPENIGKTLPATPKSPPLMAVPAICGNLLAAARIVFFLDFDARAFAVSFGALLNLVLLDLFSIGLVDYIDAQPEPVFNLYGLSRYCATSLLTLAGVAGVCNLLLQRASLLRLLVMVCAAQLVIHAIYFTLWLTVARFWPDTPNWMWSLFLAAVAWMLAAIFRILRRMYRQPAPSALYSVGIYAFFSLALAGLLPQQRLYYPTEPNDAEAAYEAANKIDVEALFYRQTELLGDRLAALKSQRAGKTDLYFVGFAGQADEQVFSNEVSFARDLLDRRFQTAGRSLLLLNNTESVDSTPLANSHNLDIALQGMAARMDKQQDVLFLFLSSHGAKDQSLSVSFWPLGLNDLRAEQLKAMLDKAGIRNRVIVVSACYSGGFLDVLKDDDTLILTASSRDHVSYGCGDFTQYTYFGESYFVKALANGDSFVTAFDRARQLIEDREKSEGKDASAPQIHVGRNIGKLLRNLEVFVQPMDGSG